MYDDDNQYEPDKCPRCRRGYPYFRVVLGRWMCDGCGWSEHMFNHYERKKKQKPRSW